jgi:hypothetical protein
MTDYNDGKIHGWNGGECPVHPKSVVQVWFRSDMSRAEECAEAWNWAHGDGEEIHDDGGDIIAFRVTKAHREPREWWIVTPPNTLGYVIAAYTSQRAAENCRQPGEAVIHVREVL